VHLHIGINIRVWGVHFKVQEILNPWPCIKLIRYCNRNNKCM